MDVHEELIRLRKLVEEVQDNLYIITQGACQRTPDGLKLGRVTFGLDVLGKVIGEQYVKKERYYIY